MLKNIIRVFMVLFVVFGVIGMAAASNSNAAGTFLFGIFVGVGGFLLTFVSRTY